AAQSFRQSSHSCVKLWTRIRSPQRHNFCLSLGSGMFYTQVETAPAQGVADAPLFIRGQHNKRNAPGLNRAQFGNAQPPFAQQLQQHCLEPVVYLVQLINQQDTGSISLQRTQKRAGAENAWLCSSVRTDSQSKSRDLALSSTQSLCKGSSNLPMAFSSLTPS
ncbi:MAG: hypothetical protein JWO19_3631, partial [Bryobacterales bacterium]|nr:hypothetical protein [Bryobacterales bacterium]